MTIDQNTISLVTTVLNDRQGCVDFLEQMEAQTYIPDEIVVVDGGSSDGTWEFLQSYQPKQSYALRLSQDAGCNVARGRNLAIAQAKHEIIASTDIGCTWEPEWLEELIQPLLANNQLEAVMGSWKVRREDLKSEWAEVEYAIMNGPQLIASPKSHASSRSIAYRKSLWKKIGGYPEDLTLAGDDMVFALLLHQMTNKVAADPVPRCYWDRVITLKAFCKESRRNFRGASEAGIWFDYAILVGGRILLEAALLVGGMIALALSLPMWVDVLLLSACFSSVLLRLVRLRSAIQRYNSYGHTDGIFRVLIFEYLIKIWALIGFCESLSYGAKDCQNCRMRLKTSANSMLAN